MRAWVLVGVLLLLAPMVVLLPHTARFSMTSGVPHVSLFHCFPREEVDCFCPGSSGGAALGPALWIDSTNWSSSPKVESVQGVWDVHRRELESVLEVVVCELLDACDCVILSRSGRLGARIVKLDCSFLPSGSIPCLERGCVQMRQRRSDGRVKGRLYRVERS